MVLSLSQTHEEVGGCQNVLFLPSPRLNVLCGSRHFSRDGQKQKLLIGLDTTGHMIGRDIIMLLLLQTQFQARWLVS